MPLRLRRLGNPLVENPSKILDVAKLGADIVSRTTFVTDPIRIDAQVRLVDQTQQAQAVVGRILQAVVMQLEGKLSESRPSRSRGPDLHRH